MRVKAHRANQLLKHFGFNYAPELSRSGSLRLRKGWRLGCHATPTAH